MVTAMQNSKRLMGDQILRVLLLAALAFGASTGAPTRGQALEAERAGAGETSQGGGAVGDDTNPGGWVVAAFLGGASTASSALRIAQPSRGTELTFRDVRFDGRSLDPPLYYGFRGGYFRAGRTSLGVEAEFIHLKVFSDPRQQVRAGGTLRGAPLDGALPLGQIVQQYSISHGANLLLFNVAARHALARDRDGARGRLLLTGRAGIGPTIPHTESAVEGQRREQYEFGRAAWQLGGGLEVRLRGGLHALGEYKFTRTRQRGKIFAGEAESLLRTHHGVFGLSYHF